MNNPRNVMAMWIRYSPFYLLMWYPIYLRMRGSLRMLGEILGNNLKRWRIV